MSGARVAIALGSNLDDPEAQVRRGFDEIASVERTRLLTAEADDQ